MEQDKKTHGALIGSIIIIFILVIGGIYIWQSKVKNAIEQKKLAEQKQTTLIENSKTSAELNSLEQEINTTDTSTGVDVNQIQ
jgi:uncharacterized protein HemX